VGPGHPWVASARMDFADQLMSQGGIELAQTHYQTAESCLRVAVGRVHPLFARAAAALGNVFQLLGPSSSKYREVLQRMEDALAAVVRAFGRTHIAALPVLEVYGEVCRARFLTDREYELRVWAVEVMAATYGESSPLTDDMREKLVKALIANGRVDQVRALPVRDVSFEVSLCIALVLLLAD
jgi:hypothetical protein